MPLELELDVDVEAGVEVVAGVELAPEPDDVLPELDPHAATPSATSTSKTAVKRRGEPAVIAFIIAPVVVNPPGLINPTMARDAGRAIVVPERGTWVSARGAMICHSREETSRTGVPQT